MFRASSPASFLQLDGDLGLIETGPTSTLPALSHALRPYVVWTSFTTIAVTHIHLDHAGAVGQILRMARAFALLRPRGRPAPSGRPLAAPQERGHDLRRPHGFALGEVVGAPEDRVMAVQDGDVIRLGGTDLQVVYTPGHAGHHMALFDAERRTVFTGDVAGVRLAAVDQVRPPTPPPDLDPEAWKDSVAKLCALDPEMLYLTHYGPIGGDLNRHFDELLNRLDRWIARVESWRRQAVERDQMVERLQSEVDGAVAPAAGGHGLTIRQFELATPWGMTVDGILHYLEKRAAA